MVRPPEDVLPGIVALELPLVHTDGHLIWIAAAEVYPEGMTFSVLICGRCPAREGVETGPGTWRCGVQFSDARKATARGVENSHPWVGHHDAWGAVSQRRPIGLNHRRTG